MNEDVRAIRRELTALRSQLNNVESRARQTWVHPPMTQPATPTYYLICSQGNLLTTVGANNYYGMKQPASDITTIPTVIPSAVAGACPDGLTPGLLVDNSGSTSTVWVGVRLKPGSDAAVTDYLGVLAYRTPFISRQIVQMPLVSDATVFTPVYLPWRI